MRYLPQLYWLERRLCNLRCSDGEHQKLTARLNQHADIVNACRMETRTDKSKVTTTTKGSNKTDLHELSTVQEGEPALSAWEPPLIANMHIRIATVTEAMVRLDKISHDNTSRSAAKCRLYKFPSNCVDGRCPHKKEGIWKQVCNEASLNILYGIQNQWLYGACLLLLCDTRNLFLQKSSVHKKLQDHSSWYLG